MNYVEELVVLGEIAMPLWDFLLKTRLGMIHLGGQQKRTIWLRIGGLHPRIEYHVVLHFQKHGMIQAWSWWEE